MGFFSDIISATVKVALTPVAIVKDVANIATGEERTQHGTYYHPLAKIFRTLLMKLPEDND